MQLAAITTSIVGISDYFQLMTAIGVVIDCQCTFPGYSFQDIFKPCEHNNIMSLTATKKRVDNRSSDGSIMISIEQVVLTSYSNGTILFIRSVCREENFPPSTAAQLQLSPIPTMTWAG